MADGSLIFDTKIDSDGFQRGVAKLRGSAGKVASGIAKSIGIASTAVTALGGFAVKAGMNFDAGMSEVSAISGATGKDLDMLRQKAKDMGASTKFSATESAEALKYMAMAGWKPEQMMRGLDGVINLAAASGENLATVSDIVTDSLTAFGMSAEQSGEYADILAATTTNANTNVSMLGESFKYVAPLAGTLGYTAKDTSLALGLMANAGIKGSQAGTSLKTAFTRLAKPTKEVADGLKKVGLRAEELQGIPLKDLLVKLRKNFKHLTKEQQAEAAASIFGKEAMAGMLAIINAGETDFNNLASAIDNSAGSAKRMAKIMNDNLKGDITILKSSLEGFAISLYENVDNPLRKIAQSATKHIEKLNDTVKNDMSKLPQVIGDIFAQILTDFAKNLPKITQIGSDIIISLLDGLNANSGEIGNSIAVIMENMINNILVIGEKLLITGAEIMLKFGEGIAQSLPNIINRATNVINNLLNYFIENVDKFFAIGTDILMKLADGLEKSLPTLIPKVTQVIISLFTAFANNVDKFVEIGLKIVNAIVQGVINALPVLVANADKLLLAFIKVFLAFKGLAIGKGIVKKLADGILSNSKLIKNAGKKVLDEMLLYMKTYAPMFKSMGKSVVSKISTSITSVGSKLMSTAGGSIIGKLIAGIGAKFGAVIALGGKFVAILVGALSNPIGWAVIGVTIIGYILGSFDLSKIFKKGGEIIGSLIRGIWGLKDKLFEVGKNIIKGLFSAFNYKNWLKAGKGLISGFIKGIKGKKDDVKEATKETVEDGVIEGTESADLDSAGKKTVPQIVKGIKSGETDISQGFKELLEQGINKSDINGVAIRAGKATNDAYLQGLISSGGDGVKIAWMNISSKQKDEFEAMKQYAKIAGWDNMGAFKDGVDENGNNLIDLLKEKRKDFENVLDWVEWCQENGSKGLLGFGQGIEAQQNYVREKAEFISKVARNPLEFSELARSQGLINIEKFGEGTDEGIKFVNSLIQQRVQEGKNYLEISEELRQIGLTDMQGFTDGVNGGLIPVEQAVEKLKNMNISETLIDQILRANGYTNTTAIADGIKSGTLLVENSSKEVGKSIQKPIEETKKNVDTSTKEMMNNAKTNVETGKKQIESSVSSLKGNIEKEVSQMNKNVSNDFKKSFEDIGSSVKKSSDDITNAVNNLGKSMDTKVQETAKNIIKSFKDLTTQLNNLMKDASTRTQQQVNEMCSRIVSNINNFQSNFNNAGYNLMQGLANGIYSGYSAVINASIYVMRNAVWAAKREAGIHSPSKVMRDEVGKMLSQGLGIGIEKEGKNTLKTAKSFISDIIGTMSRGVDFEVASRFSNASKFFSGNNTYKDGNLKVALDGGEIVTVVNLDGREITRSTAKYMSRELAMDKRR